MRHGIIAETIVLEGELVERFHTLLDALKEEYQPTTTTQVLLVETMAVARWRLVRTWAAQKSALDREIAFQGRSSTFAQRIMRALRPDCETPFEVLLRYETTLERIFFRALSRLLALQKTEVESEAEPEKQTVSAERTQQAVDSKDRNWDLPATLDQPDAPRAPKSGLPANLAPLTDLERTPQLASRRR